MTSEQQEFRLVELARRLANVVRPGVVAEADYALARARVKYGEASAAGGGNTEAVTDWLPWLAGRAGGDIEWWAPEVGEQVLVLAPSGELATGIVLAGLYSDARPAPASSSDRHVTRYIDGAEIEYDRAAHRLRAVLPEGGTAEITAPDGVTITGDVAITGDVTVTGGLTATENIDADGNVTADGNVEAGGNVEADGNVSDGSATTSSMSAMRTKYNAHVHGVPPGIVTPVPAPTSRM